jgi:hypothetical protein
MITVFWILGTLSGDFLPAAETINIARYIWMLQKPPSALHDKWSHHPLAQQCTTSHCMCDIGAIEEYGWKVLCLTRILQSISVEWAFLYGSIIILN